MPYYLVESFRNGLDRRRNRIATKAGALWTLQNAHVSPGGDIEKRLAFVELLDVTGTQGLAAIDNNLFVFGTADAGPTGTILYDHNNPPVSTSDIKVYYVKLAYPFSAVLDWEVFSGNMLVSVLDAAGTTVQRYYNGQLVTNTTKGHYFQAYKSKMYAVDGSGVARFSAINDPTNWEPLNLDGSETGAGYIDMSATNGNSPRIYGMETYYDQLAFFGEYAVQFWTFQADPKASQLQQVLQNTGTFAPLSPQQFGNGDVLYLATSGIRSLKARTNNDAAGVTDIGSAIDSIIQDKLLAIGRAAFSNAFALVHPREGRFWMVIGDEIYVLSLFPGPDVSAWSTYKNDWIATAGTQVGQQIALRTVDKIYLYGGLSGKVYGDYPVIVETPYFTADKPANFKNYMGLDLVGEGTWTVDFSLDPRHPDDYERVGIYDGSTLTQARMALRGHSPVIGLKLTNQDTSDARLSQLIYHYEDSYTS